MKYTNGSSVAPSNVLTAGNVSTRTNRPAPTEGKFNAINCTGPPNASNTGVNASRRTFCTAYGQNSTRSYVPRKDMVSTTTLPSPAPKNTSVRHTGQPPPDRRTRRTPARYTAPTTSTPTSTGTSNVQARSASPNVSGATKPSPRTPSS
ncbi:hypothetical protein GCM10009742_62710 [Kribbella karoonensis]|uniref:Uncharacterized protein n=1 Tax=Kribbella karoonensis TaxID=324851 RepID=A0ABN2EEF7_9ACTN